MLDLSFKLYVGRQINEPERALCLDMSVSEQSESHTDIKEQTSFAVVKPAHLSANMPSKN